MSDDDLGVFNAFLALHPDRLAAKAVKEVRPDGRRRYVKPCVICGGPSTVDTPSAPAGRCITCRHRYTKHVMAVLTAGHSDDECWPWPGALKSSGYGSITRGGRPTTAHRGIYEMLVGPIPAGLHLDHLCRNRACVNPDHLEPVTPRENTLRGETLPALNARKTHCLRGHPFDDENTYLSSEGKRYCKTCQRERKRRLYKRKPRPQKTHCLNGHPFDEANTYGYRGYRHCLKCQLDRKRRYRREQKEKQS